MIIISTADDHLSPYIWTSHRSIAGDSYYAMGMITKEILKIKEEAGDEEVILLKAGDIFDTTTPDPYTERILKSNMEVISSAGVKIFSVQGNHEFHAKTARATLFGTIPLSVEPLTLRGVSFCGLDYTASTKELHEKISMLPPCDYLVMHSPFKHLLGFEDKFQVDMEDIPAHIKNVVVGDIHKQSLVTNSQGVNILSPGASHPRTVKEIKGGHGLYVHKHEEGIQQGRFINVSARNFHVIDVASEEDLEKLRNLELGESVLPPVVVLQVLGTFFKKALFIAENKGALVIPKEIAIINEKIKVKNISDIKIPTLLESLSHVIQAKKEPEAFGLLEQLLPSDDPESVLDNFVTNFMEEK